METYSHHLLQLTQATAIAREELIQTLWSGYGKLLRLTLEGGKWHSLIVKLIAPPNFKSHPRGWNTDVGHQRKLRSYQVEENWYRDFTTDSELWRTAAFIAAVSLPQGRMIVMEDLDAAGFPLRKQAISLDDMKSCLAWLAHFHAFYLGRPPLGLWEEGTYWHLDTRPEELQVMADSSLKRKAGAIDQALKSCQYRTLVHGDAKLANFCFAPDGRVAAVDFQYVGGGCGIKDVAYFLSSCLDEDGCARYEKDLLNHYFAVLGDAVKLDTKDRTQLEAEWRGLYPMAWADFTRFLEGWMPSHRKLHRYSREMVKQALRKLRD